MNRRSLLKMLGMAAAGTVAHEQLSWLVRQPVSVQAAVDPRMAYTDALGDHMADALSYALQGLVEGSSVRVYAAHSGELMAEGISKSDMLLMDLPADGPTEIITAVRKPGYKNFRIESTVTPGWSNAMAIQMMRDDLVG